jgi:predicted RNA-binding protein Jag
MKIKIENEILILHFNGKKDKMNEILDEISNQYEGIIKNREGHNFPSNYIPSNNILHKYKNKCKYVIAVYNNKSIQHELLHAKYYTDNEYREKINKEWDTLPSNIKTYLTTFLKKLGYNEKVIVDEYQAYKYTESRNFFGIKL